LKKLDRVLLSAIIILTVFGIIMIYSASSIWAEYKFNDSFHYIKQQGLFAVVGIIGMYIISKIDYKIYYKKTRIILSTCLFLLILVIIPGIGSVRNGSRSWFGIGSFGVQPSEFAKLGLIIFTSKYLTEHGKEVQKSIKGVIPILLTMGLFFGLIMLQPDLGTGTVLAVSVVALLFIAGMDMKFFYIGGVLGIIGIIILIVIAPYRMDRITSFVDPWQDPLGTGFQIIQSLYAIGPGGLLGMGFLNSRQKHFYLPEPQTDFIFSIISEEFGFLGIFIVSSLFLTILYRGIKIALNSPNEFSKYLSFGIIFQILFQTLMNLMVVVGLIPVTGVTLPFLSYGGSSLLITLFSMGILLNISRNQVKKEI